MKKVLVVLGPTATGKTDLALSLAKKYNGELISCDSRQVYKKLDIGTGKEPNRKSKLKNQNSKLQFKIQKFERKWVINGVNIWMYDVVDPKIQYTVKDYVETATKVIEDILHRKKLPIIVGGTGLYLKALLYGLPNLSIPIDEGLRRELEELSLDRLQQKLQSLSPARWKSLNESDRKNPRRLLRSIELITMNPYKRTSQNSKLKNQKYKTLKVGLTAPRPLLNQRIYQRLVSRIDQGLIKEGKRLPKEGLTLERMKELGLEYGMLSKFLGGEINESQFLKQLSVKICQYAKRQMTWFKKEEGVCWFDITGLNYQDQVEKLVSSWYDQSND